MSKASYTKQDLVDLPRKFDTFVGIDSDGCVFDSMGVKQRDHFHPLILTHYGLEKIEAQVRRAAEFFNLYSKWRGQNRFIDLLLTFEALPDMPGVKESGVALPAIASLKTYVESGRPLGNPSLAEEVERTGDAELKRALEWSLAINKDINENMQEIPPFKGVREALEKMGATSDMIVVSQTPEEALVKEWELHGIIDSVEVIAGQELGTKAEHLKLATADRWQGDRILMIGDAPGDRRAAEAVSGFFYPINPGQEEASWERLYREAYDKFLDGSYAGAYQDELSAEFEALLPETLPWVS